MKKYLMLTGKTLQILLTALLAVLLLANLYMLAMEHILGKSNPTLLGYSAAVIVSGSMEPALSVDDLIINHRQDGYEAGDIITFQNGSSLTTHRIVEVQEEGYVTQGDANNAPDLDVVPTQMVIGRVVCAIPYVGSALALLRTPLGMVILVFTGLCIIELPFFLQRRREQTDGEEQ